MFLTILLAETIVFLSFLSVHILINTYPDCILKTSPPFLVTVYFLFVNI